MFSVYDLTVAFIQRFYDEHPGAGASLRFKTQLDDMLAFGWTVEDITNAVKQFESQGATIRGIMEPNVLRNIFNAPKGNLIAPSIFYYHNELRVMSSPPKRSIDYNTGEIVKTDEPFYLEMRASYTVDNLIEYYGNKLQEHIDANEIKRLTGIFSYLLKSNTLEEILFAIDAASSWVHAGDARDLKSPFDLKDWVIYGKAQYWEKATESKESGDDRIVPRQRVLTFRGRHPV